MSTVGFLLLLLCLSLSPDCLLSMSEAEALLAFKKSMSNAESLDSWKPNSDPCKDKWEGVFCDEEGKGVVIRLHLTKMSLSGTIDVNTITQIKNLKTLSLSNNTFEGALPPFNMLKGLRALYVSSNKFSGEIPGDYFADSILRRIWLSDNEFSGKIPYSLGKVHGLMALHLERNKFIGAIPEISQESLTELDMSGNQLEGQIPASMERFGADAFKDNSGLCGKPVSKECVNGKKTGGNVKVTIAIMIGIVVIMALLLLLSALIKSKNNQHEEEFDVLNKESAEDVVEVRVHGNAKTGSGSTRSQNGGGGGGSVGGGSSRKSSTNDSSSHKKGEHGSKKAGSQQGKNAGMGDLIVINDEKGSFGLADLMKASAEVLGNGALGSAYKAVMSNGVSVVVKRIRDMNQLGKDEFDAEIRRIGKFRHKNILTPLAYHYRKEEKLVVSEYVPKGSLLYVLHGMIPKLSLQNITIIFLQC